MLPDLPLQHHNTADESLPVGLTRTVLCLLYILSSVIWTHHRLSQRALPKRMCQRLGLLQHHNMVDESLPVGLTGTAALALYPKLCDQDPSHITDYARFSEVCICPTPLQIWSDLSEHVTQEGVLRSMLRCLKTYLFSNWLFLLSICWTHCAPKLFLCLPKTFSVHFLSLISFSALSIKVNGTMRYKNGHHHHYKCAQIKI